MQARSLHEIIETSVVHTNLKKAVLELVSMDKESHHLKRISALLSWDQELYMPKMATKNRAEQLAFIELKLHESITQYRVSELLHICEVQEDNQQGAEHFPQEVRLWLRAKYREWKKNSSLPPQLVSDFKKECSLAHFAWVDARKNNDYTLFKDNLARIISFNQNIANCLGYEEGSPYDALLDQFEPNVTTHDLATLFDSFKDDITQHYSILCERHRSFDALPHVARELQQNFIKVFCEGLGFHKDIGHLGVSEHPFSVSMGDNDTRITTRYIEHNPLSAISSVMHEMGHAFYDLGISPIFRGTVCDDGASHGIHESQSRFIENMVGKHSSFWEYWYPHLCTHMPAFSDIPFDVFLAHLKKVEKQSIRVDADEIGYTLHIIVRFEIEKALIEGDIGVEELPDAWNAKYKNYLGIDPKNDSEGVLQDVHWSEGFFGYFPSYALGNLYAAQLFYRMKQDIPEYEQYLRKGSLEEIKTWLGLQIHRHGASKIPSELVALETRDFMHYIKEMYV